MIARIADYGILQNGNRNGVLTDAQLQHAKVTFAVLRDRWKYMEPRANVFDFTYNLQQVKRVHRLGKGYVIGVMTGGECTPDHVAGPRYKGCLVPWADEIPKRYRALVYALSQTETRPGLLLKDDPAFLYLWVTGATVPSQELHLTSSSVDMTKAPGFNQAGIVRNIKACMEAVKECFPDKPPVLSLSGQTAVLKYQSELITHMKKLFGKQAMFQHNSMGRQTSVNAPHHRALVELASQGYRVLCEMGQPKEVAGLVKFPQRTAAVIYPGDERLVA